MSCKLDTGEPCMNCTLKCAKPQLLGTGLTIDPCAECKHASFCSTAGACLRKQVKA